MSSPKISIVTATLNALPGLRETTESIQAQSFRDFEHIVIDGGSVDGTRGWLEEHSNRIRWVSGTDDGIGDAINRGLKMANGEWILVLHAEDTLIDRSALETAAIELGTDADIVSFDVLFSTASGDRIYKSHGFSPRINFKTTIPHQGAFARKKLFDRVGPFDPTFDIAMDYEFFLRAYRQGASVEVAGRVLSRMPDTGISSRLDWPSLEARFAEERMVHERHVDRLGLRLVYGAYWSLYPIYRRIRSMMASR